jgi:hypothetical protein
VTVTVGEPGAAARVLVGRTLSEAPFFRAVAAPTLLDD